MGGNWMLVAGTALAAAGVYASLPPKSAPMRAVGAVLAAVALGIFVSLAASRTKVFAFDDPAHGLWSIGAVTLISALASITSRNPVYCALWFGLTLFGTAGLFLWIGASFLAVATVIVYAGAILVTFLFVLMLAAPDGDATCDRVAWEPLLSATAGAVLIGILTTTLVNLAIERPGLSNRDAAPPVAAAAAAARGTSVEHPSLMAKLGKELFTTHLATVEAAAALLFAGLVGAAAIVAHGRARDKVAAGALPAQELVQPNPPIA